MVELKRDRDLLTEEEQLQWHHHASRASAFEEVAQLLLVRGGELFMQGKDEGAKLLRALAATVEDRAKDERAHQEAIDPMGL